MQRLLGETDHVYSDPTINDPLFSQPCQLLVNLGEEERSHDRHVTVTWATGWTLLFHNSGKRRPISSQALPLPQVNKKKCEVREQESA